MIVNHIGNRIQEKCSNERKIMKMKKLIVMGLTFAMVLSMAACGSSASTVTTVSTTAPATEPATEAPVTEETAVPSEETVQETGEAATGKTLVVYYSASGNTRRVAEAIARAMGGDLFEIVPTEVYSNADLNWTDSNSRVSREHNDESLRDVPLTTTEVADWDAYGTVFIGYPIWWGIAAWPVDNFVKANDFTGKTVIPFATSASSGMGQSGGLLAGMANGGDWQEGHRFSSGASDSDVQKWVNGLGL